MVRTLIPSILSLLIACPALAQGDAPEKPGDAGPDDRQAKKQARKQAQRDARRKRQEAKRKDRKGVPQRDLDPSSLEAEALSRQLRVDAHYAKDGTVDLLYTFREPTHLTDWSRSGFDLAEGVNGRGKRKRRWKRGRPDRLALGVGSRRKGLMLHRLQLEDEYTVTFHCTVDRMSGRSDLVFFVGKSGARFGSQLVSRSKTRFRRVGKKKKGPTAEAFNKRRRVTVKLVAKDGVFSAWINGEQVATTKKLRNKIDGQVGIFARDMLLLVDSIGIRGKINKAKLGK